MKILILPIVIILLSLFATLQVSFAEEGFSDHIYASQTTSENDNNEEYNYDDEEEIYDTDSPEEQEGDDLDREEYSYDFEPSIDPNLDDNN